MNRKDRLYKLSQISEPASTEKAEDKSQNKPSDQTPSDKPEDKKEPPKEEQKPEEKKHEQLYSVFASTPYGSFDIKNDMDFQKSKTAVLEGIKKDFSSAKNLQNIIEQFESAVTNNNANDIKSSFSFISEYKNKQKETEKKAFMIFASSIKTSHFS